MFCNVPLFLSTNYHYHYYLYIKGHIYIYIYMDKAGQLLVGISSVIAIAPVISTSMYCASF